MSEFKHEGWIGCDLDGTLAEYYPGHFGTFIGQPIPLMKTRVLKWLADGYEVRIMTARATDEMQVMLIKQWLVDNGFPPLEVTNMKDYNMLELWDDRAVQVEMNTGKLIGHSTRGL
jgi:hypothetical protein